MHGSGDERDGQRDRSVLIDQLSRLWGESWVAASAIPSAAVAINEP